MTWKHTFIMAMVFVVSMIASGFAQPPSARAEPQIFASPVHAGCYLERIDRCKIHVEPFTIRVASGEKLANFTLLTANASTSVQTVIYDFRPDQSNPVPRVGDTFTPSLVAQDYAATCGASYAISLQGQDTGDSGGLNLGMTGYFTCPTTAP